MCLRTTSPRHVCHAEPHAAKGGTAHTGVLPSVGRYRIRRIKETKAALEAVGKEAFVPYETMPAQRPCGLRRRAMDADQASLIIDQYGLQPHPEGGFFAETYRSPGLIPEAALPAGFAGERNFSTAIVFLLRENDFSALHRLRQDEVWHFYLGGPLRLVMIAPDGKFSETILGRNGASGELVQALVPAGHWFGAKPTEGAGFSFAGCTVAPGFDFADFELAERPDILARLPGLEPMILEFTR